MAILRLESRVITLGWDGQPYRFRPLRRFRYARVLRPGKTQPLVRAVVCRLVRPRLRLWISARAWPFGLVEAVWSVVALRRWLTACEP
jgi:hypothetical protein